MLPKSKRGGEGFTLIELLVVIAIIGLLSTLAIVALGTARQKSRDARRLADIRQIQTALEMYNSDKGAYPVTSSILLGDTAHACLGSNGFQPAGACTSPFLALPKDPSGGYYIYSGTATYYTIGATLEGEVGDLSGFISANANSGAATVCPSSVSYSGQNYSAVMIGSQCWFKQNLNVGTMLANAAALPTLGDGSIQKWCYDNATSTCATEGGLYTWAEANQLGAGCDDTVNCTAPANNQGICPAGWHIPTDQEFKDLEMYLGMTQAQADLNNAWRGTDVGGVQQGTMLKAGGSSGFEGILAGSRSPGGSFGGDRGLYTNFRTATRNSTTTAFVRGLGSANVTVYRFDHNKLYGFSVRCIKN